MPLFIIVNLSLSFIQLAADNYLLLATRNITIYAGLAIAGAGLLLALMTSTQNKFWHDLFASGIVVTWFADWHDQFPIDAPMFFYFPLYFSFLIVFVNFFFINHREHIDEKSMHVIQLMSKMNGLVLSIITLVLISLTLKSHFLLFPIAITFFILHFTLIACQQSIRN
jgi:hypothetical protein